MKNKNKLIEEMAHELRGCNSKDKCGSCNCIYNYCDEYYDSEIAITKGYRKLSKGSIVLTKAEKEKLLHEMYEQGRFDAIADLEKEGKVVISNEEYEEYQDLLKNFDNYLFEYRKFADKCIEHKGTETAEKWHYHITTTLLALWKGNKITAEVYNSWTVFFNSLAKQFGCDIEIKENN